MSFRNQDNKIFTCVVPHLTLEQLQKLEIENTRNYPLRAYILGVLTHTTAWDQLKGGDETLKFGSKIMKT